MDITWVNAVGEIAAKQGAAWEYTEKDGFIKWTEGTSPTESEITAKISEMEVEWDTQAYARNRKAEYDALNQFEMISDDDVNGTTTHKDAIAAIKAKWPKDNSGPV